MSRLFSGLAAAFGLLLTQPAYADLVIDPFSEPVGGQVATDTTIGGTVISPLGGLMVLGGSREFFVDKTGPIGMDTQSVSASSNEFNTDIFNFDQFSSTAHGTARLVYDGGADGVLTPTGFTTGVDLTQSGTVGAFVFSDMAVTGSGLVMTVNLYNDATGLVVTSGPQLLVDGFAGNYAILYSSFLGAGDPATPMNVGAIEILIDGSSLAAAGSDLRFGLTSSANVPEPSFLAFGSVASLIGLGCRLRQRRAAKAAA